MRKFRFREVKSISCYWRSCDSNPRSEWLQRLHSGQSSSGLRGKRWGLGWKGRMQKGRRQQDLEVPAGEAGGSRCCQELRVEQMRHFSTSSHSNTGLLPPGANCLVQEETPAELHPLLHFPRGRQGKWLRIQTGLFCTSVSLFLFCI